MKFNFVRKVSAFLAFIFILTAIPSKLYASDGLGWVYFLKYGGNSSEIWRVKSDGSSKEPEKVSSNFDTSKDYDDYINRGGDYFYYLKDSGFMFRIPAQYPVSGQSSRIIVDNDNTILNYRIVGDYVYILNEKKVIKRFPVNAANTTEIKNSSVEIANMIDGNNPAFFVEENRIYYNALKDGRELWVASRAADGSGEVTWICPGVLDYASLAQRVGDAIYMIVNTNPTETQYSTNCMVLYHVPVAGGVGTALSEAVDVNAIYSGMWTDKYYMFNDNVEDDGFPTGEAKLIGLDGTITELHDMYVFEIVNVDGGNKYVFVDGYGTLSADIVGGVVSNVTDIEVADTYYVRNLMTNGEIRTTALFGENGTYVLNKNLEATKLVGVEWDMCLYRDDVNGIFYINAGDDGKLYKSNEDGTERIKLTDDKVLQILTIEVAE